MPHTKTSEGQGKPKSKKGVFDHLKCPYSDQSFWCPEKPSWCVREPKECLYTKNDLQVKYGSTYGTRKAYIAKRDFLQLMPKKSLFQMQIGTLSK